MIKLAGLIFTMILAMQVSAQSIDPVKNNQVKKEVVTEFDNKDHELEREEFTYDQNGRVIEEKKYKLNELSKQIKYKYDIKGNKVEEIQYLPSGKMDKQYHYKYDALGRKVER